MYSGAKKLILLLSCVYRCIYVGSSTEGVYNECYAKINKFVYSSDKCSILRYLKKSRLHSGY